MSLNDPLANALSNIENCEKRSKKECLITPYSKTIKAVLDIMNKEGYVGKYEEDDRAKAKVLKIHLLGSINKCGAIKPQHFVKNSEFEKFEKRYLAAKDFGVIIVTTSKGIMTHQEAKKNNIGGKLLAYCY